MKKGDLILIPFPFTDLSDNKLRPAVILFTRQDDFIVSFITSQLKWKDNTDLVLKKSPENGLKVDSVLKTSKIATIDKSLIVGILGYLKDIQIQELNEKLKIIFEI